MPTPLPTGRTLVVTLLLAPALLAAQPVPTTVDFGPAAAAKMQRYGVSERATVQSAIVAAVSRETNCSAIPAGLAVTVTVDDIAPTRPTREQLSEDPSLDVYRTKYLGGAKLTGEVRDAGQHVVATVSYRYFPLSLRLGSVSRDPWADARLAIDGFALKLAGACRNLPLAPTAASVPR